MPVVSVPAGGLLVATVTLTDAQVKALPTTPIEVLPAQGAGVLTLAADSGAFPAVIALGATNVAYTNVDANATWQFVNPQAGGGWAANYSAAQALTYGPSGGGTPVVTICSLNTANGGSTAQNEGGEDQPVRLQLLNGALGNLTGGNAANTCQVWVYYQTFAP